MQKRRKSNSKKSVDDESSGTEVPVYCVCRSTDVERFMIACDQCEEWYHGDCINVTPKQAEQIKTFYCAQCRCKNPSLEIEYKNTRNQKGKPSRQNMSPSSSVSTYADQQPSPKLAKSKRNTTSAAVCNSENNVKRLPSDNSNQLSSRATRKYNANDVKHISIDGPDAHEPTVSPSTVFGRNYWPRDREQLQSKRRPGSPRMRPCGQCEGCNLEEDCGKCDFCRDRRKFGGPNRMRQKCRLRQCVGMLSSRSRNPSNSSQSIGARRRKQQPAHGIQMDIPSPSRIQSYIDFDDEPFEVPIDLSPRPYIDPSAQNYLAHNAPNHSVPVGSKMRRGDHRLPSNANDIDNLTSRQYSRVPLGGVPSHSRNKGTLPSIYPLNTGEPIDFVNDDSDDDIVLPPMTHCAGPACMSAAIPGEKYCSDICKAKHTNSRAAIRPGLSGVRSGVTSLASREANAVPYNLPYPDHMYCRHHRVQNWHSNGSSSQIASPPYRSITQSSFDHFAFDQAYISEGLRQSRGHQTFHYSTGPMHHISQRQNSHTNQHPVVVNPNGRLGTVDSQGHTVMCDTADTAAFIDSISSAMRRNNTHGFAQDLGIDLPHQPPRAGTHLSPSPGLSGVNACYATSDHGESVRSVDLHHVDPNDRLTADEEDDGDIDQEVSEAVNHPVYGYYMMGYNNETTNGHPQRVPLNNAVTMGERRLDPSSLHPNNNIRPMSRRLLTTDNNDASNNIGLNYSRGLTVNSTNMRHPNLNSVSAGVNANNCLNSNGLVGSSSSNSTVTSHPMSNYLSGPDEFYTINDSDNLEINWPQETVAGVNG